MCWECTSCTVLASVFLSNDEGISVMSTVTIISFLSFCCGLQWSQWLHLTDLVLIIVFLNMKELSVSLKKTHYTCIITVLQASIFCVLVFVVLSNVTGWELDCHHTLYLSSAKCLCLYELKKAGVLEYTLADFAHVAVPIVLVFAEAPLKTSLIFFLISSF